MRKGKSQIAEAKTQPAQRAVEQAPNWRIFFRCQRSPILRSQILTALMAGTPFEVDRLPSAVLLDVVLLSMTTRNYYEAEIVDDYDALLRRTDTAWKEPTWSCKVFDQVHSGTADFILRGTSKFHCAEEQYIPDMVKFYLEHDVPAYFAEELV